MQDSTEEAMTGAAAIKFVAEYFGVPSKYAMAKALSDETLKVQPIQINNYLKGKKMRKVVADRFFDVYGVTISDYCNKDAWVVEEVPDDLAS